jgi:hypothetical protein
MTERENLKKWKQHNITNGEMKISPFFIAALFVRLLLLQCYLQIVDLTT